MLSTRERHGVTSKFAACIMQEKQPERKVTLLVDEDSHGLQAQASAQVRYAGPASVACTGAQWLAQASPRPLQHRGGGPVRHRQHGIELQCPQPDRSTR